MTPRFCSPESIFLGHNVATSEPVCVPRSLFGHLHSRGMTGAGKTSLDFLSLVDQFSVPYQQQGRSLRDLIVVVDLGGDQNFFHNTLRFAERDGREFQYLILDDLFDSYCFDPFQALVGGKSNIIRMAQMLVRAFHMDHGLVYGGNYYSQSNLGALLRVARLVSQSTVNPTLADLAAYLDEPKNRKHFKDADQVRMTFDFLLEYPQLCAGPDPARNIDIARAYEEPKSAVLYFFLPTVDESLTAPLVGGLALYSVLATAVRRKRLGLTPRRTIIFVDEFQEIVGRSLSVLLAQIRKFGVSLCMANQSTTQLKNRDIDLASQVFEGTVIKNYHTCVGDDDVKALQSLAKEKTRLLGGSSLHGLSGTNSTREIIVPGIDRDTILEVSARRGDSFLVLTDHAGYRDPIHLRQAHHYPDLSNDALPLAPTSQPVPATSPLAISPERAARHVLLRAVLNAKQQRERWQLT